MWHYKQGNLFFSMNQPEAAVVAFGRAQELRPDLRSYQEALHSAREAMKAVPQSAKALKLGSDVHASNSGGREKAEKFYESALRLEPGYLGLKAEMEMPYLSLSDISKIGLTILFMLSWLKINPQNEAAKRGLERLEKQMKMPPKEDEENEVEDADGEQIETEVL
ncbi:tetratricopeptide repeat (TPR)-containing protein [Actinidia rufa]|uniref:Tetratricopeptide repeat (TPR)-containing protein n=1 Tax=Actinidia rufa TaxID=165716 RepID=A0A7J0EFK4_9ERIC|nr:tetratricopeptide repeat (TPR)-containing protein [Actinidia rufa]